MFDRRHFFEVCRRDFGIFFRKVFDELEPGTPFVPGWHYQAQAHQLERVFHGETRRLIINVPPRSAKSILGSVALPMYVLGHRPHARIICVSHTEDLAREFSLKRRLIGQTDWYQAMFPAMRLSAARDLELKTTQLGSCFATGIGGAITGRGADLIVIDDPLKGIDAFSQAARRRVNEFYDGSLISRLNDKKTGSVVLIMQRLHEEDLTGHLLEKDDWDLLSLPAIATEESVHPLSEAVGHLHHRTPGDLLQPEREPMEVLEALRRSQGSLVFQAQYQQQPVPANGNIIRRDWIRHYDEPPQRFDRLIASWDTASTISENADYSVGTVWGAVGADYYLLDVIRQRMEFPELRTLVISTHKDWGLDATVIEDADIGRALISELNRTTDIRPVPIRPRIEKEARLLAQAVRFETGQVHLPAEAPWLGDYLKELLAFPLSAKMDQVDSTSQALDWLSGRAARSGPLVRRNIERRQTVDRR